MAARKRSTGRKKGGRKYGQAASKRVSSTMRRRKKGTLKSGSGRKVTLGLKELLEVFLGHRFDVVRRRSTFRRSNRAASGGSRASS